jgi:hypothetical protein
LGNLFVKILKDVFIPNFNNNSYKVPLISQKPKKSPKNADAEPSFIKIINEVKNREQINIAIILSIILPIMDLFHDSIGLKAHNNIAGTINGIKTASKYGGPTETLELLITSIKIGYNVPKSTVAAADANIILLITNAPSLLIG